MLSVRQSSAERSFVLVARRWDVARPNAWLTGLRRLATNYELISRSRENWRLVAHLARCLNRLAPA